MLHKIQYKEIVTRLQSAVQSCSCRNYLRGELIHPKHGTGGAPSLAITSRRPHSSNWGRLMHFGLPSTWPCTQQILKKHGTPRGHWQKNVARTRWTCSPFTGSVALCQQRLSLCAFLHREITWDDDAVSGLAEMTPPWMAPGPEAGLSGGQLPLALGYCCWWFF